MKRDPKTEITRLDQGAHHLSGLLDALWNLAHSKLDDAEVAVLLQAQMTSRRMAKAIDECSAPLNISPIA